MSSSNELIVNFEYDFLLFGIVSPAKDYKLAWLINQSLPVHLVKAEDLKLETNKDSSIVIANFIFKTAHCTFRLLKNGSYVTADQQPEFLLPDQQHFNYLLMIHDHTDAVRTTTIEEKLNEIQEVAQVQLFDVNTLLFKENLIF